MSGNEDTLIKLFN